MMSGSQEDTQLKHTCSRSTGMEVDGAMSSYKEREYDDDSSQMQAFCIIQNGAYFNEFKFCNAYCVCLCQILWLFDMSKLLWKHNIQHI